MVWSGLVIIIILSQMFARTAVSTRSFVRLSNRKLSQKCATSIAFQESENVNLRIHPKISCPMGDAIFIPFTKAEGDTPENIVKLIPQTLHADVKKLVADIITEGTFSATESQRYVVRLAAEIKTPSMACKHIVLIALDQTDSTALDVNYGRAIVDISKQIKAKDVSIFLPNAIAPNSTFKLFSGVIESSYEDRRYKQKLTTDIKKEPACNNTIKSLSVVGLANTADKEAVAEQGRLALAVSGGVTLARDLVGAPPNSKTPLVISAVARQLAKQHPSFSCQVLEQEECEDLNMGAFLSVQKGSKFPPQFIHMTYRSPTLSEKRAPLRVALIGKGLTFDSGGYNLKVGASSQIEMMKVDMGGLGAVMGTARAIADLQPENMEVHFISAVCENMVSENAMRPGDIVAASNGKTIEILNTDAEGRLTLADALVYADKLDVDVVIDLATLTGACVVALGQKTAAVYSDHRELMDGLMTASERTGDDLWPLPLKKGYKKNIKSKVADIKNVGSGGGGSITAALFLQEFISTSKQWAHIDMAGPVYDEELHRSTGFGVKLLTDFLLTHAKA